MSEESLFDDEAFEASNLLPKEGEVFYYPDFLNKEEADEYFKVFSQCKEFTQDKINFGGGIIKLIPRLQAWYGDPDKSFTYSGITLIPSPWTEELLAINKKLKEKLELEFTSVLMNLYRNGSDSVAWHCDNSPELGLNPIIASISLGSARTFKLRNLADKSLRKDLNLKHGSLLVMKGETQHKWEHHVPKEEEELGARINLTYRIIQPITPEL